MSVDPCLEALQDASFRGVSFLVDTTDIDVARRIVTHQYPNRDDPDYEDLGERYREFKVKGYVHGSNAIAWKNQAVAAARQSGPALLVLPAEAPFMARCLALNVTQNKDRQGWFDLSFTFRAERNTAALPSFSLGMFEGLIGSAIDTLASALVSVFGNGSGTDTAFALGYTIAPAAVFSDATVADAVDLVYTAGDLQAQVAQLPFTVADVLDYVTENAVVRTQSFAAAFADA